jgi:hypothetical protein
MRRIIFAIIVAVLPGIAFAQTPRPRPPLTGNVDADFKNAIGGGNAASSGASISPLDKPFQDLANFIGDDIDAAITLSTSMPSLQDGNGQKCLMALKTFGDVIKAHPAPLTFKIATDLEAFRLKQAAINKLCSSQECETVFSDFTQVVTALSPVPLPVPNIHDLCAKVPQVNLGTPVATSPAPTPTPATPANP